jgi:nitroreductase
MNIPRRSFLQSSALLGSGVLLTNLVSTAAAAEGPAVQAADFWNVIKSRRSVRKFRPEAVPDKDIEKMIEAASLAPSSGGQQPWKFLVIRDKDKIHQMKEACVKEALAEYDRRGEKPEAREQAETGYRNRIGGYFTAPVFIVVLTDNSAPYPEYSHWDGPLAAGYLLLAARALGYGTVFITDSISDQVTKEVLHIPSRYTRVCITPVGIPVEWPSSRAKKKLEEFIAYENLGS